MLNVPPPDDSEASRVREQLRDVEVKYAQEMIARGFDISQDENLALPATLAKLYQAREELRVALAELNAAAEPESE